MIRIRAMLDADGVLVRYSAAGHGGFKGADIVCAAVSALSRALLRTLDGKSGVSVRSLAPERGLLQAEISCENEARPFVEASGRFLLAGLASVAEEYPELCSLEILRR